MQQEIKDKIFKILLNHKHADRTKAAEEIAELFQKEAQHPVSAEWVKGNYDRLYDQLKADVNRRIVCFVDYDGFSRRDGSAPCRDVCTVRGDRMEFLARGIGYGGAESWLDETDKRVAFLKDCVRLNVEWLDEIGQSNKDAVEFAEWVAGNAFMSAKKEGWLLNGSAHRAPITTEQLYNEYQKQNKQ